MASVPALLRQLPLEHIIGSPLTAAINAQAMAARSTVDFINSVGLQPNKDGQKEAVQVDFKFDRTLEEVVDGNRRNMRVVPSKLTVPLLAIVPVPFIRISDMTVDFEYKVREVDTSERSEEFGIKAEVEASFWCIKAKVEGSYSNKSNNKRETDQSATLRITVNAAQDNIPEGLARVLDMMHEQLAVVPLERGALVVNANAVITNIDRSTVKIPTNNAQTLRLKGEHLDNPELLSVHRDGKPIPTVGGSAPITVSNLQTISNGTELSVDLTLTQSATPGAVTIRIATTKGIASAQVQIVKD